MTTTATAPAAFAGVITVIDLSLTTLIEFPALPPNFTDDMPVKLVPVIVTIVPPAVGPLDGVTDVIVGAATYVKPFVLVADPSDVVNTTSTTPADFTGATTLTEVALTIVTDLPAVSPNITDFVPRKFVPVIVTLMRPAIGPLDGDTDVIVGAATYVKPFVLVADPPGVVNTTSTTPANFAGTTTLTDVSLTLSIDVTAVTPNITDDVPDKLFPVIVTIVPPASEQLDGDIPVIDGNAYVVNDMTEPVVVPLLFDATIRK